MYMDKNKNIDIILKELESLQDTVSDLQINANDLNEFHQQFVNDNEPDSQQNISEEFQTKLETIIDHVYTRSTHIEQILSSILNPVNINHRINTMKKIEQRKQHWLNKAREE